MSRAEAACVFRTARLARARALAGVAPAFYFRRVAAWTARQQALLVAWGFALVATIAFTFLYLLSLEEPVRASSRVLGLWPALPILPLAFARPRLRGESGGRPSLLLFAVLALLSFDGYTELARRLRDAPWRVAFRTCFLVLVALGVGIQGLGIQLLASKKEASAENNRRIEAAAPELIPSPSDDSAGTTGLR